MNILEEKLFHKFGHRFKVVRKSQNVFEIMELIPFHTDKVSGMVEEFLWYDTCCTISTNKIYNNFLLSVYGDRDLFNDFFRLICDMFENGEMTSAFEMEQS